MHILTVEGLSKRYKIGTRQIRELWALRDVSFTVERGEILGIIGPNGAGKTTLLKVLSRVTPPTEGRVVGHGRVVPLLALGAGFQPDLSGRENVFLNAAMYGVTATEVEQRLESIVEFANLEQFIDMPVKRYSSGMYLRLAFSVAINMDPDILLADEVLAVGDLEFQERCLDRVKRAGEDGMSVLFVSHDMAAITRLCDRVLWLDAGGIVRIGEPEQVAADYQTAAWSNTGRALKAGRGSSHKSNVGEILSVSLVTAEGSEVGAVRASDDVYVRIVARVDRGHMTCEVMLHVQTRGMLAFRSRSTRFDVPEPGTYVVKAKIPRNVLAASIYTLNLDFNLRDEALRAADPAAKAKTTMSAFNVLAFQVYDPGSENRQALGGVVAPVLEWSLDAHGKAREAVPAD